MIDKLRCVRLSALLLFCGLASAQTSSGSETHVALSQTTLSGGGASTSSSVTVETGIGQAAVGAVASSESFLVTGGVVPTEPILGTSTPIVFGVRQGYGSKDGNEVVTVVGVNFAEPGAGAAAVQFDGVPAFPVAVVTDTRISARTPAGVDALGNPKAEVPVRVTNAFGTASASEGFTYAPALVQYTPARIGKTLRFHLFGEPLTFHVVAYGGGVPSVPFGIFPFDGKIALATVPAFLTGLLHTPSGLATYEFTLPDQPNLIGATLELQVLAITDVIPPIAGSFTNVLAVQLQP